jgi:hypothetical protein
MDLWIGWVGAVERYAGPIELAENEALGGFGHGNSIDLFNLIERNTIVD